MEAMKDLLGQGSFCKDQSTVLESVDVNNLYHLADLSNCVTTADPTSLQDVLEETGVLGRLRLTLLLQRKDLDKTARQSSNSYTLSNEY